MRLGGTNGSELPRNGAPPPAPEAHLRAPAGDDANGFDPLRANIAADSLHTKPHNGHRPASRRRSEPTGHLKLVPEDLRIRERIKSAAEDLVRTMRRTRPLRKDELAHLGRSLLEQIGQPESYLGFTMVLIGNSFWREQFLATPFERRLLLLPRQLEHVPGCLAADSSAAFAAVKCVACSLSRSQDRAEQLGYRVLAADRSSVVLNTIVEGAIDGILGVAHMDVLEKAVDKVLIAGVPSYVVPLHSEPASTLRDGPETTWNESWLEEMLERYEPRSKPQTTSYVPLMRAATRLFTDDFERLLPRVRSATAEAAATPLGMTEEVAYDWLANGGKRFRPFITLAAYAAVTQIEGARVEGARGPHNRTKTLPFADAVCRVAMAIEAFHKASLVHDDIQDDDQFRYGRETLHRSQGLGPAINIGDYLIGLGYRLVNSCYSDLGSDVAADIVQNMADAHIKLCDGQGAEMAWQLDPDWSIQPEDALQIYALKTSPAFEAALYAGLRMAGPVDEYATMIPAFARHLGVGFQVINDLLDWQGDADNKLLAGQDALAVRPTMLLAFAWDAASDLQREELRELYQSQGDGPLRLNQLLRLFIELGAFDRAAALVDECKRNASALAQDVQPPALGRLLRFLVDTVLSHDLPALEMRDDPRTLTPIQPVASP